ncbi:MAG TPA: class II aldolase/adducin family protein [Clostridia bacterium]|nr:class II aldolase/adducin family protein [Clostridia bacterium]
MTEHADIGHLNPALKDLVEELVFVSKRLYGRGLVAGTGGNISVRVPGLGLILIKRSGVCLGDVVEDDFLAVNFEGDIVSASKEEGIVPSKELPFHLAIYSVRPDVNSVIHTHSPYCTAYAVSGKDLSAVTAQAESGLGRVPLIPFAPPGSDRLARLVAKTFGEHDVRVALLEGHGVVAVGRTVKEAYYTADLAEETAKVCYLVEKM